MRIVMIIAAAAVAAIAIAIFIWWRSIPADKEAANIIDRIVAQIEPILKEDNLAYWNATTTGDKKWYEEYKKKEMEYRKVLSDKTTFKKLEGLKDKNFKDPLLKRQVQKLYFSFLENQIPEEINKEMVEREAALVEKFDTFRAVVGGAPVTDNEIRQKMKTSLDVDERQRTWEASKQVGKQVAADLVELVKLRNEAARLLGFKDYYAMQLTMQEFKEDELGKILSELADFTKKPFAELKSSIDAALAKRYSITAEEVRPWHYEDVFFQEVPHVFDVNIDQYFKGKDVTALVQKYYASIGLDVNDILKRSDLLERKGKEQHAYCTNIDRKTDIRILANVKDDEYWTGTMLHELGHGVYDEYMDPKLPFLLREPASIFTTEAIAEMFGRLVYYPQWLEVMLPENADEIGSLSGKLHDMFRAQMLIFARWVLVMVNFEKELYRDPDQNLNALWWDLVEKYQLVHAPNGRNEPDWAAKIHFSTAPVYYHHYILGEMFASQISDYIQKNIPNGAFVFVNNDKLGPYLKEKIFAPADTLKWDALVENATGEPLNPKHFADQFAR